MKDRNRLRPGAATLAAIALVALGALALAWMAWHPLARSASTPLPPSGKGAFAQSTPSMQGAPVPSASPADERFVIKRILPITGPIKYGEWHWDDQGVPPGPLVITVDLDARVLSIFKGGYEIGASAVLLGTSKKPTPLGVFPVRWKDKDHYSSTYDNAPMPYTMNLTEDGVSIHGTKVEKGYASHGCIGVPDSFGARLFTLVPVGTKVYITKGKMVGKGDSLI